jgi:hypothetical protein
MQLTDWPLVEVELLLYGGPKALWQNPVLTIRLVTESPLRLRAQGPRAFLVQHFHEEDDVTNDDFTYRHFKLISFYQII